MEDIELIAAKLNEAGYEARSNRAIQHRAYSFKILLENRQLPYISEQVVMVYNKLTRENERISQEIKSYIKVRFGEVF